MVPRKIIWRHDLIQVGDGAERVNDPEIKIELRPETLDRIFPAHDQPLKHVVTCPTEHA